MTRSISDDGFGAWYRVRTGILMNLLQVAGPAHLQRHNDPRILLEQDYKRRRDLHRRRLGKPPVVEKPEGPGLDPVVLCAVAGLLAVALLVVWAVSTVS